MQHFLDFVEVFGVHHEQVVADVERRTGQLVFDALAVDARVGVEVQREHPCAVARTGA